MKGEELKKFIAEHIIKGDLSVLLLGASRYPDIDVSFAVEQIAARRQIREKLPSWYENGDLIFPSRIAAEQCSSEQTATYKQQLIGETNHLCDLTGGLGIDSYFFSLKAKKVTYIERFALYCERARHNFSALNAENIDVWEGDGTELFGSAQDVDVFYLDPARRGEGNKRVFALSDCEPDLTVMLPLLLEKAPKVIAKISPMADIQMTLELLSNVTSVHIVSVRNECKELLFVMERGTEVTEPDIVCVNYTSDLREERYVFKLSEERSISLNTAKQLGNYLYEPNASILKAGAFKSLTTSFAIEKLHVSSHLYTSGELCKDFPGRTFVIDEIILFSSKTYKQIAKTIPQANITTRNFPLQADALRKKVGMKDGGDIFIFATTMSDEKRVLIKTHK